MKGMGAAVEFFKGPDQAPRKSGEGETFREMLSGAEIGIPGLSVFGRASDLRPVLPIIDHQHKNKLEVIVVFKGMRRVSVSGVTYTLYPNQAFVTCPNESHASLEEQPCQAELLWFQLDMGERSGFLGMSPPEASALYSCVNGFRGRILELPPGLTRQLFTVYSLLSEGDALDRIEAHALFISSLIRLLRCKAPVECLTPEIDAAKQYILLHVKELIDPDELLLKSGLSMGEFRQRFQSQIGCSPREYINRQKIERAKQTLVRSKKTVADIAYEYHFSSPSFFKVLFRRETGMSPKKYQRKHQGGSE